MHPALRATLAFSVVFGFLLTLADGEAQTYMGIAWGRVFMLVMAGIAARIAYKLPE